MFKLNNASNNFAGNTKCQKKFFMKKLKVYPFLTIIMVSTVFEHAQKTTQLDNSQIIEAYKTLIKEKMRGGHLVGVGAAIILNDSVVWKEGFGYADKEN